MEQSKKQLILNAFDKAIENSNNSTSHTPLALGFVVV